MTPEQQYLMAQAQSQAAQHDDPHPTPVCPASPGGAMPLQSATLSHKNFPIPKSGLVAATQRLDPVVPRCEACGNVLSPSDGKFCKLCSTHGRPIAAGATGTGQYESGRQMATAYEGAASRGSASSPTPVGQYVPWLDAYRMSVPGPVLHAALSAIAKRNGVTLTDVLVTLPDPGFAVELEFPSPVAMLDASKLPDWKDLDLRPSKVWQMKPEPKMESYEGIPAEVINEATIVESDSACVVIQKLEEQMKGKWVMVRMPPEEVVNVRGEQRSVDEYCVATSVPCAVPSRAEALAMREMVEKAAEAMRLGSSFVGKSVPELIAQSAPLKFKAELRFDEGTRVVEGTYDPSFLDRPRQHDSPLSARVVPAGEAPDPKVGW